MSILVEGAAAHSVSRNSAIKLGLVGTLVGTELVHCSSHFGTPITLLYVHRSLPYTSHASVLRKDLIPREILFLSNLTNIHDSFDTSKSHFL